MTSLDPVMPAGNTVYVTANLEEGRYAWLLGVPRSRVRSRRVCRRMTREETVRGRGGVAKDQAGETPLARLRRFLRELKRDPETGTLQYSLTSHRCEERA